MLHLRLWKSHWKILIFVCCRRTSHLNLVLCLFFIRMAVLPHRYREIISLLLENDSLACGLHLQQAGLVGTTFLVLVCFTKTKCRYLPCTSKSEVSAWVCQAAGLGKQPKRGQRWRFITAEVEEGDIPDRNTTRPDALVLLEKRIIWTLKIPLIAGIFLVPGKVGKSESGGG